MEPFILYDNIFDNTVESSSPQSGWVCDTNSDTIYNIALDGTLITSFLNSVFDASSVQVSGVGLASDNTLWVCDSVTHKVYNITTSGSLISSFANSAFDAGATGTSGIATAADGTLWVCDLVTDKIYNITTAGVLISSFATSVYDAAAVTPNGITCKDNNTLWICDFTTNKIYNVSATGTLISSFDNSVYDASSTATTGVSTASDDTLWVSDSTTNKVYNVTETGALISSFATSVYDVGATNVSGIYMDGLDASAEAVGDFSPANIADLRAYTFWKPGRHGTKYLTIDAGSATAADSLVIMSHNLFTATATVSLESSTTGAWAGEEVEQIAGFIPSSDLVFTKLFTSATIRHWRVKIVTASVVPQLAICLLGARMDFPVYPDSPFTPKAESMNVTSETSKGGHLLGVTSRFTSVSIGVSFTWPTMSFIDGDFKTFWEGHGREGKPFFWVPNFTEWADRVHFVRFPDGFSLSTPQSDTTNADSLSLSFEGIAE